MEVKLFIIVCVPDSWGRRTEPYSPLPPAPAVPLSDRRPAPFVRPARPAPAACSPPHSELPRPGTAPGTGARQTYLRRPDAGT